MTLRDAPAPRRGLCQTGGVNEPLTVRVYYDFASTLAYVTHRVMERISDELAALALELHWVPIDLVGITGWRRGAPVEGVRRDNAQRVASELGVPVRMPRRWLDSRLANAIALELAATPREPAWRERVFSALHEQGRPIESGPVLGSLARDLGFEVDPEGETPRLAALERATRAAYAVQVTGVPTFMLGEWPIGGIQPDDVMLSLLGRWAERARTRESA